ncbi:unnamed protein product, partial [marine sediment metagenome]
NYRSKGKKEMKLQEHLLHDLKQMNGVIAMSVNQTALCLRGMPDVVIYIEGGTTRFVEVKVGKDVLSDIQKYRIKQLQSLGFEVDIVRTKDDIYNVLKSLGG